MSSKRRETILELDGPGQGTLYLSQGKEATGFPPLICTSFGGVCHKYGYRIFIAISPKALQSHRTSAVFDKKQSDRAPSDIYSHSVRPSDLASQP